MNKRQRKMLEEIFSRYHVPVGKLPSQVYFDIGRLIGIITAQEEQLVFFQKQRSKKRHPA